jgi:hypothetical protein
MSKNNWKAGDWCFYEFQLGLVKEARGNDSYSVIVGLWRSGPMPVITRVTRNILKKCIKIPSNSAVRYATDAAI